MVNHLSTTSQHVLAFVGRYRVVTRPVLAELLRSQTAADKQAAILVKSGLLSVNKGLPQRRVAYQLTPKGVAALGLSRARARRFGMQALIKHLGVLLLCADPTQRCERVETATLGQRLDGEVLPEATYCLLLSDQGTRVAIAYVPAPDTPIRTIVRRVRKMGTAIRTIPAFAKLRTHKRIGVLVVTDRPQRRAAIEAAVRRPQPGGKKPVIRWVRVWVRCVPELGRYLGLAPVQRSDWPQTHATSDSSLNDRSEPTLFDQARPTAGPCALAQSNESSGPECAITPLPGERHHQVFEKGVPHEQQQRKQHQG